MPFDRRTFLVTLRGTLLLSTSLLLAAPHAVAQQKVRLVFTALPASSSVYLQAVQHMSAVAKITGYDITVQESAGSEENVLRIDRQKAAQLGIIDAVTIKSKYGDKTDVRSFANGTPNVWQIIVSEDSNIRTLKDLNGKKFNAGPTGGGSTRITMSLLNALGIKHENFEATLSDALDAYADRRIVGLSYRGAGGTATGGVVEANATRPIRIIGFSDSEIELATKMFPGVSKAYIEANIYPRQPDAIPTIGSWQVAQIGIHKSVPEDVVYNLIKAYYQSLPDVAKSHKSLGRVTPENSVSEALLPLHRGAIRYYRERGIAIPDNLIPPEAR